MLNDLPRRLLALMLLAGLSGCGLERDGPDRAASDDSADLQDAIQMISVPAGAESGRPRFSSFDDELILSWTEPVGDSVNALRYSTWADGGWSEPQTAASGANWFVNWADTPGVVFWPGGTLLAHYLVSQADEGNVYAYDIHLASSRDETWATNSLLNDDDTASEHGFVSSLPSLGGLVWLDGRSYASTDAMSLRFARVNAVGNRAEDVVLDDRVCDCCPTDAAATSNGAVVVYRDRSVGEIRDIAIVRLVDGVWSEPAIVYADGWEINGCPVNGPAVAAQDENIAVAWFTGADETPRVLVAFSSDGGSTFSAPIQMNHADAVGRVDAALASDGSVVVSWLENAGEEVMLQITRVHEGMATGTTTIARFESGRASGYPVLAVRGELAVVAWTDPAEDPSLQTATLALAALK